MVHDFCFLKFKPQSVPLHYFTPLQTIIPFLFFPTSFSLNLPLDPIFPNSYSLPLFSQKKTYPLYETLNPSYIKPYFLYEFHSLPYLTPSLFFLLRIPSYSFFPHLLIHHSSHPPKETSMERDSEPNFEEEEQDMQHED